MEESAELGLVRDQLVVELAEGEAEENLGARASHS